MKILSLSEENVKRLQAVELSLDNKGSLIVVAGNNEQGKSSLLDGIEMALCGGGAIPPKPIRKGQDKAKVEMTLGEIGLPELTVKRTFTAGGGGTLTVSNKDGSRLSTPQAILDALVGTLSFDPLSFAKMSPTNRSETLRQLLALDFSKLNAEHERLFHERADANRRVKAKQAMLAGNPRYLDVPAEEQSVTEIADELERAMAVNAENAKLREKDSALAASIQTAEKQIASMGNELQRLRKVVEDYEAKIKRAKAELAADGERLAELGKFVEAAKDVDQAAIRARLNAVESVNVKVRKNKEIDKISADYDQAKKEADALTKRLDEIDRTKRDAIAAAKFPVKGMSLGDSGEVLLDGLPFEQASSKGQLLASLAMGAALNPKLRVLIVRSGNDLDDKSMVALAKWAEENNMQVWIERVSTSGKVSVIIEDGRAVEPESEPTPKTETPELLKTT